MSRVFCSSLVCFVVSIGFLFAQSNLVPKLQLNEAVPNELLATRSVLLYTQFTISEREEIQKSFVQTGIDTEVHLEEELVLAGKDITQSFVKYFNDREIRYLVIFDKLNKNYRVTITSFNKKRNLVDQGQPGWSLSQSSLKQLLETVFRSAWMTQKKQNFLINAVPESDVTISAYAGTRREAYSLDLKVDGLAVPLWIDATADTLLKNVMKEHYPFKYTLTQPVPDDAELRKKGFVFILCVAHARGSALKELLGYNMTKAESAYASTTYPNGTPQVKTLPAETTVYKFYVKHISSGNIFLGTKWDADTNWEQALKNYIKNMKAELRLE